MLGFGRKNDGFVWNKYVRTVIVERRRARRERLEQARIAAIDGAKASGEAAGALARKSAQGIGAGAAMAASAGGRGARRAGALAAAAGRRAGAVSAAGMRRAVAAVGAGVRRGSPHLASALQPLVDVLGRPGVALPLMLAGGVAVVSGVARIATSGKFDRDSIIALAIGAACLLAVLVPRVLVSGAGSSGGRAAALLARIPHGVRRGAAWGTAALAVVAGVVMLAPTRMQVPTINLSSFTLFGSGPAIIGRASALGADTLRIGDHTLQLAGIEAPERDQVCQRSGNRRWRCGAEAASALSRLVDGKALTCERNGSGTNGRILATCHLAKTDIGASLVRSGHVFAADTMLASYGSEQKQAQAARRGLWQADKPERPAAYRARLWEEAKARAPEGCPIKGTIVRRRGESGKVYHLPWAPAYAQVRVRPARGERWFCSEAQATQAGFRPSGPTRSAGDS